MSRTGVIATARTPWCGVIIRASVLGVVLCAVSGGAYGAADEIIDLSRRMMALERAGNLAGALPLAQKTLAMAEAALGPEHPTVAIYLEHLGILHRRLGQGSHAESHLRRALVIRESRLGPEHPAVAITLTQLAISYQSDARTAEAEPLFRRALEITERTQGPMHPRVATVLHHYAGLLRETNRPAEAELLEARARTIEHSNPSIKPPAARELTSP